MFAKLFYSPKYGQILITKTTDDHNRPVLRLTVDTDAVINRVFECVGLLDVDFAYEKCKKGQETVDTYFANITEELAEELVVNAILPCSRIRPVNPL